MLTRLKGRFSANTRLIAGNSLWEGSQQAFTVLSGALISMLLILVVPVAEYGVYSYALALLSIGTSVMTAGLNGLAVKALIHRPLENASIVSGLLIIREVLALLGYVVIVLVSTTAGNDQTVVACMIAGLALLARALDAPEIWYQAKMRTKRSASLRLAVVASMFIVRLLCLLLLPTIWTFIGLLVLESALATILIFVRYIREGDSPKLSTPDLGLMAKLLKESWPLLLSGVANQVNLRGNVIFVQSFIGSTAAGVYSAAARLSEVAYFLPAVVMNSVFPLLLKVRAEDGQDGEEYKKLLQKSYDRAFWLGVFVACLIGGIGFVFITVIFGAEYDASRPILLIQLAACPFLFMATVYSKWIIAEGLLWSSLVRHALGMIVNVGLNMILIPGFGVTGSAIAATASYIVASFLACFLGKRTRFAGVQMGLAVLAPILFLGRSLSNRRKKEQTQQAGIKD